MILLIASSRKTCNSQSLESHNQNPTYTVVICYCIDVNNTFVEVNFDHKARSFQCTFHNQPQEYIKRCSVGIASSVNCDQPLRVIYNSSGIGDSIQTPPLVLNLTNGINEFCFSIKASSGGNRTVIVEGTLNIANNNIGNVVLHVHTIFMSQCMVYFYSQK